MRLPWSALGLVGAIASSIPLASSHEIHLAYLPVTESTTHIDSYLSVKWTMQDGSLYANNDRVFPPTTSMQVHAPQYDGVQKTRLDHQVQLYYSLDARPLSSREVGAPNSIVRVSVELFDQQGNRVTPNTMVLDLLDHPDGSLRITKIRIEPGKSQVSGEPENDREWHMKFWQSEMGILSKHPNSKEDSSSNTHSESEPESTSTSPAGSDSNPSQSKDAAKSKASGAVAIDSTVGYIFSPYFAPASYNNRPHRRPHGRNRDQTFMRLISPVVLPAFLGAMAGLIACLLGFIIGHVIMSVYSRLGLRKRQRQHRRSRISLAENGTLLEKAELIPAITVTEIEKV